MAIAGLGLVLSVPWCKSLEKRYIHALAPEFTAEKLQGMALQKEAFAHKDLLVLYGSSELVKEMPNNASQFFQDYPTGFRVFPVGKSGLASLAVLQKVAAVGDDIEGCKVAYSISPGWFFTENFEPTYYEGNFSELQAFEVTFSDRLSYGLKSEIARRMLEFPKTLEDRPLLEFGLRCLAGDSLLDRCLYYGAWPLGRLQCGVGQIQDHVGAALHILEADEKLNPTPKRGMRGLNWNDILKRAAKLGNTAAIQAKKNEVSRRHLARASRDKPFLQAMHKAKEWTDLELLMRTFKELGADPMLLSMPIEDIRLEVYGISASARSTYVNRLDALADLYSIPLDDFRSHQGNNGFLVDFLDHLSAEGWLFYNKALDDFYHDRMTSL
jgi:D-alanine transfer protein